MSPSRSRGGISRSASITCSHAWRFCASLIHTSVTRAEENPVSSKRGDVLTP